LALDPRPSTLGLPNAASRWSSLLLAVTLVMAVAFLVISRHERGSVTTSTETVAARLAADSALANAQAQIAANIFATGNPYNFGLLVSTNYLPPTTGNYLQDLASLFVSPRPPVFVPSPPDNYVNPTNNDFRFYLDLNRNGYDPNGYVAETNDAGQPTGATNFETGDPEWIGVLERPDAPYGPNNPFISRYCFIAIPADGALDLNYIYNQAMTRTVNPAANGIDGFLRNEGVGSWEINLAAFLADLNTNQWDFSLAAYNYNEPNSANAGYPFADALSLLSYRYNGDYTTLALGSLAFENDGIDEYADGPLMTSTVLPFDNDGVTYWAGSDNTNHFFDLTGDLFDSSKTGIGVPPVQIAANNYFSGRLLNAGNGISTYDRYTFYRMLGQLGTDSAPESGKMNVNYDNLDPVNGVASATNLLAWTPIGFFTNAADRLLRGYTGLWLSGNTNNFNNFTNTYAGVSSAFGVTNIPVLVNGRFVYTPTINRLLQLAANMYDAVYYTNHFAFGSGSIPTVYLPSVFQPVFGVFPDGTNMDIYITNFVEVTSASSLLGSDPVLDLNNGPYVTALNSNPHTLVFGVPLIIGAKKGFPNFNAFALQTEFGLERKLQVTRATLNTPVTNYVVNQMFTLSLSNQLAVECWNSYTNLYARQVDIVVSNYLGLTLTNDEGFSYSSGGVIPGSAQTPNGWPGFGSNPAYPYISTIFPLNTNLLIIPDSIYRFNSGGTPFLIPDNTNASYEFNVNIDGSSYPQPRWNLTLTNDLQVIMVDDASGRIIDYVQLSGPNTNLSLAVPLAGTGYNGMWDTNIQPANIATGLSDGINYQLSVSKDIPQYYPTYQVNWNYQNSTLVENEIDAFRAFYRLGGDYNHPSGAQLIAAAKASLKWQVPYTPATNFVQYIIWQANDPLVHYLATDLTDTEPNSGAQYPLITAPPGDRYQPWNRSVQMASMANVNPNPDDLSFKDPPAITLPGQFGSSDFWDFPTNKFPGIGWLGRVHRGTPWQTVFLKATNVLAEVYGLNTWENWTGNLNPYDAANAAPVEDRLLFDFFTTAPNDNATRGQLSINQPHIAAWSALLSGIAVPTNLFGAYTIIQPAGVAYTNSALGFMLQNGLTGINDTRANYVNADGLTGVFEHVGDILAVHALNDQSPFLAGMDPTYGVSDEMYEWLPQQTMSLLRVSSAPRYVIYSYGQALKPAPNAIVAGGAYSGMVTNYQVVSEMATRSVVRFTPVLVTNSLSPLTLRTNYSATVEQFNILPPQ
jgi:hypothetical protein